MCLSIIRMHRICNFVNAPIAFSVPCPCGTRGKKIFWVEIAGIVSPWRYDGSCELRVGPGRPPEPAERVVAHRICPLRRGDARRRGREAGPPGRPVLLLRARGGPDGP